MISDRYLGLIGVLTLLLAFYVTISNFLRHRSGALLLRDRELRLPDATRFEDLRRKVVDHQDKLDALQEDLLNAREEIGKGHAVRGECQQLTARCDTLRTEVNDLEQNSTRRKHDAEVEYGTQIRHLQSQLNQLEQEVDSRKRKSQQEIDTHKSELTWQYDEFEREIAKRKQIAETEVEKQIRETEGKLLTVQEELTRRKRLVELETQEFKLGLERRLESLKNEVNSQEEIVRLGRETELQRTQHQFDESLFQIRTKYNSDKLLLDAEQLQLENRVNLLREKARVDQEFHDKLAIAIDSLHNRNTELKLSVATLQSQKAQLEKVIPTLQQLWDRLLQQTGGGNDVERTAELWQPVLKLAPLAEPVSEEQCLKSVEEHLESCGLYFSPRMLYAFHTSLKVASSSPLVVLAGISGTGKSELPLRYAEAVGMNFLPMPVQPRWDSPQDMFGFFNYLENRFRATELGRALVQMDPYGGEADRGWPTPLPKEYQGLSDQMLLVLLDEMNLARVEYYFSDFLSKLETRRGVDKSDAEKRRKAELAFEIGRTGIGSPVMNVFVGTNVLFVGTMNEDETTQTLSDKVIDRSNLIRFGCPRKLDIENTSTLVNKSPKRIAASTWQSWQSRDIQVPSDRERTDEYIRRLNESMSKVRRPFAHRTSQAIRAYVANYPTISEHSFNHAIADQIEQKLLPKFRGLDPSESDVRDSLDKIRGIVEEIEDQELLKALQESRTGHQFAWSGVDRAGVGQSA